MRLICDEQMMIAVNQLPWGYHINYMSIIFHGMFLQGSYRALYSMLSWYVGLYTSLVYDVMISWQGLLVGQMEVTGQNDA